MYSPGTRPRRPDCSSPQSAACVGASRSATQAIRCTSPTPHLTLRPSTSIGRKPSRPLAIWAVTKALAEAEAEEIVNRLTGKSEIQYETRKAEKRRDFTSHSPAIDGLTTIDEIAAGAFERGADYISTRRLSELLGATSPATYATLTSILAEHRPARHILSAYRTGPLD